MIIDGIVEQGKHLGRRLGYPTANIAARQVTGDWPGDGVYAAAVWIGGDDRAWPGMLNQGVHPTAPEGKPTVEAHIMGFDGDIYGLTVRVEYLRFLRPERRFDDLDALKAQLAADRAGVMDWLAGARRGEGDDPASRRVREISWHDGL